MEKTDSEQKNGQVQSFDGFEHFTTHHCWTGSLRHIYAFHRYPISEEMLLGLGEGVGFIYWHMKGTLPFLGGRGNFGSGSEGLEITTGRRTGVVVDAQRTASASRAEKKLLDMLGRREPVMLVLDMGYLPYFDFGGEEFHFGSHVVVACGYDAERQVVLLADRDDELHPVSLEGLARARGSIYKPFPPQHGWFDFDFQHARPVESRDIHIAVHACSVRMIEPPISNLGVKGIRKAAERIRSWPETLDGHALQNTCIQTAIMIDARGGTGGGLFRCMYARFLEEAADMTGRKHYLSLAEKMRIIAGQWETAAKLFQQAYEPARTKSSLDQVCDLLPVIADQEETAWAALAAVSAEVEG